MTPEEADRLGVQNVCQDPADPELQLRKVKSDGLPVWAVDGVCVFYKNGCSIHDQKPGLCQRFTCSGHGLAAMVYAIALGVYHADMDEEQQHKAMVEFMKGRPEGK